MCGRGLVTWVPSERAAVLCMGAPHFPLLAVELQVPHFPGKSGTTSGDLRGVAGQGPTLRETLGFRRAKGARSRRGRPHSSAGKQGEPGTAVLYAPLGSRHCHWGTVTRVSRQPRPDCQSEEVQQGTPLAPRPARPCFLATCRALPAPCPQGSATSSLAPGAPGLGCVKRVSGLSHHCA